MARPKSLTEDQRQELLRRSVAGESAYQISKATGIPESTVRLNVSAVSAVIKEASNQIVSGEQKISKLTVPAQVVAFDYLNALRAISSNLGEAARIGTNNAVRLSALAATQLNKATQDAEEPDMESLKLVAGITKTANDAAQLGMQLLQVNKEKGLDPPKPVRSLDEFYAQPRAS